MNAKRRAFTLIELLAAMAVLSVIFATMLLTLYAMQKTSHGFTDAIAATTQQQRFTIQLRTDAHQAQNATLQPADSDETASTVLEMTFADDEIVEYRLNEDQIERRMRSGATVVHQESYSVSPVLETGWSLDNTRPTPMLTVHLHQNAGNGSGRTPTLIPLTVAAALRISTVSTTTATSLPTP